ncbi:bone morphogenetic protein 10 [Striga asiatica]|uniref:Bone morphogenetic protein 10 n=1 Tax=Striga asiatica TaxID=4170 RepID=A0A5A7P0W3_STRAF|nr:bone morphogenetic protein 10 [Striga asiatica]
MLNAGDLVGEGAQRWRSELPLTVENRPNLSQAAVEGDVKARAVEMRTPDLSYRKNTRLKNFRRDRRCGDGVSVEAVIGEQMAVTDEMDEHRRLLFLLAMRRRRVVRRWEDFTVYVCVFLCADADGHPFAAAGARYRQPPSRCLSTIRQPYTTRRHLLQSATRRSPQNSRR